MEKRRFGNRYWLLVGALRELRCGLARGATQGLWHCLTPLHEISHHIWTDKSEPLMLSNANLSTCCDQNTTPNQIASPTLSLPRIFFISESCLHRVAIIIGKWFHIWKGQPMRCLHSILIWLLRLWMWIMTIMQMGMVNINFHFII